MSQAKVDKYIEYKKNRKTILAREKRRKKLINVAVAITLTVAALALVLLIGITIHDRIQKTIPKYDYQAESFILGDYAGVMQTEAPGEAEQN